MSKSLLRTVVLLVVVWTVATTGVAKQSEPSVQDPDGRPKGTQVSTKHHHADFTFHLPKRVEWKKMDSGFSLEYVSEGRTRVSFTFVGVLEDPRPLAQMSDADRIHLIVAATPGDIDPDRFEMVESPRFTGWVHFREKKTNRLLPTPHLIKRTDHIAMENDGQGLLVRYWKRGLGRVSGTFRDDQGTPQVFITTSSCALIIDSGARKYVLKAN